MKLYDSQGEEKLSVNLAVKDDLLCAHTAFADGKAELDLPKFDVSFEGHSQGLLVHVTLAGTDKSLDVLMEYDDVKALKEVPGKGLVGFVLKAFR